METIRPLPYPHCDLRRVRGPHEQIAGLMLLPRIVDAIRVRLEAAAEESRVPACAHKLYDLLGIHEEEFVEAVRTSPDDAAIAEWITERCNTTTFAAINQRLLDAGIIEREERGA
jgi:hypothetical protein